MSDLPEIKGCQIIEEKGSGGIGRVYKALDCDERIVALKVLLSQEPKDIERFKKEFLCLSSISHPNIVQVCDFGYAAKGGPYFSMEFIQGKDLRAYFHKLDGQRLYSILLQICQTLEFLHTKGIIHGDIKPSNILIAGDEHPKMKFTDFGSAEYGKNSDITQWKGTIPYIAPEIIRGEEHNHQADLYSLGVTLYEAITGDLPFKEKNLMDIAKAHLDIEPEFPKETRTPDTFKKIVLRLLKKDPIDRYYSAGEVVEDLKELIDISPKENEILLGRSLIAFTPFIGREKELSLLRRAFEQAQSGQSKLILLTGEFGVGKTRLLKEFKDFVQVNNGTVIWKTTPDIGTTFFKNNQNLTTGSYPLVLIIDDFQNAHSEAVDLLLDFLKQAKDGKVLICLVLENNFTTSDKDKKASLIESKIETALKENVLKIVLEPLSQDDTAELLNSAFKLRNPVEKIGELLYKKTGGNPFLVVSVMNFLLENGYVTRADDLWEIKTEGFKKVELPEAYREETKQRLSRLGSDSLNLLRIGSVVRSEVTVDFLIQVSGSTNEKTKECLEEIFKERILRSEGTSSGGKLAFINGLVKDLIYHEIEEKDKRTLHKTCGKVIEELHFDNLEPIIDDLAYHFVEAENTELALKYSFLAGEKAENENDPEKAIEHYENTVKLWDENFESAHLLKEEVLKKLASQYEKTGDFGKAFDLYSEALRLLKDRKEEIEKTLNVYGRLGTLLSRKGDYDEAIKLLNEALSMIEENRFSKESSMLYITLGWIYKGKSDYPEAMSFFQKAVKLTERAGHNKELALAFNGLGVIYWTTSRFDKAADSYNKALKIFEGLEDREGLVKIYTNLGLLYRDKANTLEAINFFKKSLSYQEKIGNVRDLSILYNNLGLAYFSACDLDKSLEYQHKGLDLKKKIGEPRLLAPSHNNLGLVYLKKGILKSAIRHFHDSLLLHRAIKDEPGMGFSYFNLGRVYLLKEEWDRAKEYLGRSFTIREKLKDEIGMADALKLMGKVSMATSNFGQAEKEFKESLKLYDAEQNPKETIESTLSLAELKLRQNNLIEAEIYFSYTEKQLSLVDDEALEGIFHRINGLLFKEKGYLKDSVNRFLDSAKIFKKLKMRYELGEAYFEIGKLKYELERFREAKGYLNEALNIFKSMEIPPKLAACEEILSKLISFAQMERDRTNVLYQVSELLANITDLDELLLKILDLVAEHLSAERVAVILYNPEDDTLELKAARGVESQTKEDALSISRRVIRDVIKTDVPLIIEDTRSDPEVSQYKSVITYNILSILCVPLVTRNKVLGAIYVDHRSLAGMFSKEDRDFLKAFANLVAVALEKAKMYSELREEVFQLKKGLKKAYSYPNMIGRSKKMQEVFQMVDKVSNSKASVLLLGESGTGKELIANLIHYTSNRKDKPFVKVNCAALPESILESELFGVEEKVATGVAGRDGKFKLADRGTIFFDEIADMSLSTQAKVLRVLQEREFERVGGSQTLKVDIRVISATNKDLEECIKKGNFRKDLFYRINPVTITIPPLRERKEDIPYLVDYFLENFCSENNKPKLKIPAKVMPSLMDYPWPGNVRELANLIERGVLFSEDAYLSTEYLPTADQILRQIRSLSSKQTLAKVFDEVEKEMITSALKKNNWNNVKTALELGVSEATLRRKMEKHKIKNPRRRTR
jgi:Nif-specific regulatory protein